MRRGVERFTVQRILDTTTYHRVHQLVDVIAVVRGLPALLAADRDIKLVVIDSIAFHFDLSRSEQLRRAAGCSFWFASLPTRRSGAWHCHRRHQPDDVPLRQQQHHCGWWCGSRQLRARVCGDRSPWGCMGTRRFQQATVCTPAAATPPAWLQRTTLRIKGGDSCWRSLLTAARRMCIPHHEQGRARCAPAGRRNGGMTPNRGAQYTQIPTSITATIVCVFD